MKKKRAIRRLLFATLFLVLAIALLMLSGCASGLPTRESTLQTFRGVYARTIDDETYFYSMEILTDDIDFNIAIQPRAYTELEILHRTSIDVLGVFLTIRTEADTTFTFTALVSGNLLASTTVRATANQMAEVPLFSQLSRHLNTFGTFTITIEEHNIDPDTGEHTRFVFDNLLIFLEGG